MQKLILVLLFVGFQLQLLAQESTETQALNRFYGGIEAHVFLESLALGGVRFGENRKWSFETSLGFAPFYPNYYCNMNQIALTLKSKKNRFQQFYFGEYNKRSRTFINEKITFTDYIKNIWTGNYDYFPKWTFGIVCGYRRDIITTKQLRIQGQATINIGDYRLPTIIFPTFGIRLTTK